MTVRSVAQYQIKSKLGEGGMGVVYRAWDTRLHRLVALKFLPERVASDPDALERLRREARAASGLSHPNICTVYDLADDNGQWFIAMELLEGETLQERIVRAPIPIETAIEWSTQLADALDVAHSKGIIHRDLKPSNIFITDRSLPKILDFGLAKKQWKLQHAAVSATFSDEIELTRPGSAVGTLSYMSPEQAQNVEIDGRSDLFSLGAVMYEMICRKRAFPGETAAIIFDGILHKRPPAVVSLNSDCPPELEQIVNKALEKDRDVRYHTAADLRVDLKRLRRASEVGLTAATPRSPRQWLWGAAAVVLLLALLGAAGYIFWPKMLKPVSPGEWVPLTRFSDAAVQPAISRDGRLMAFVRGDDPFIAAGQIYVKVLPDGEPVELTHDDTLKLAPAFSPDGSLVSYGTCCYPTWDTWVVPVFGGTPPRRLFANATGLSWIDQDHILFSEIKRGVHMGLMTATSERTEARDVFVPPHERAMIHFSSISPDRKWVLAVEMGGDGAFSPCILLPFDRSSSPRQAGPNAPCWSVAWSPDGRWMYFTAASGEHPHIWRQRFPDGAVEQVTAGPNEEAGVAFSPDGKYFVTSVGAIDSTVWVHDAEGERQISSEEQSSRPQFSPDGTKVFYLVHRSDAKGASLNELWSSDTQGHAQPVLPGVSIDDSGFTTPFAISPDGRRVVFTHSNQQSSGGRRTRLWMARLDNGSPAQELMADSDESAPTFTENGFLYFRVARNGQNYLYRRRADGSDPEQVLPKPIIDLFNVSRDGAWAAVGLSQGDDEPPQLTLYSLRDDDRTIPLCSFCAPVWSWDSKTIYSFPSGNRSGSGVYAVDMSTLLRVPIRSDEVGDFAKLPGAKLAIPKLSSISPSPDPAVYAYTKYSVRRNIYKIPVR